MLAPAVAIKRTQFGTDLYTRAVELRDRVLLAPTGRTVRDFAEAAPGVEEACAHFLAVDPSGAPLGCVLIRPDYPEQGVGKLMQMAVDTPGQRRGVGRALVAAASAWSRDEAGLRSLFCHARDTAVGFYEKLGWVVVGSPFEEIGIVHYRMELSLSE